MSSCLYYQNEELFIEKVRLAEIATQYGTPCYVYSEAALVNNWKMFDQAFKRHPHQICYAVKANNNLHLLRILANLGSGFDIVSGGELEKVLKAGGDPKKIVFSGVGKTKTEVLKAMHADIYAFNVESSSELERIAIIAREENKIVNIALRVNPNVEADTHEHIKTGMTENKFGIPLEDILPLGETLAKEYPHLRLVGLACHIGSQLIELDPLLTAIDILLKLYDHLVKTHVHLTDLNVGGGLGIVYHKEAPPKPREYAEAILTKIGNHPAKIIIEPGRALVGNAGVLLTQVEYLKHTPLRNFAIVDAGMNDFIRPALYAAWQNILPLKVHNQEKVRYDIAGPVCESADFLGKSRMLALHTGDILAIDTAGAYGFSMSSNYNSRPRVAEVLINDKEVKLIRRRETMQDLLAFES